MVLNFVPDGKQKAMSAISHKIDAKQLAVGKPGAEPANKKAKPQNVGEDGEVKLSKKDLKKAANKEKKQAAKAANKDGAKNEEGGDNKQKGKDAATAKKQEKPKAAEPKKADAQDPNALKKMQDLEVRLSAGNQFLCGHQPSMDDKEALAVVQRDLLDAFKFPHLYGWFHLVSMFTEPVQNSWARVEAGASSSAKKPAAKKADDDDLDLFGSDDEDDAAAAEALKKKAAEAKAKKDKPKKVVIAKSLVLFEVKPYEAETKMADMAAEILKITMDGLWWKTEWKTEPIAFGVEKLIIGCTVEDDKVSVDDLQE
jgi:elongation factor 1-beta